MDPVSGRIRLDRMLFTSTRYPAELRGFIPGTLAEDGDPVDVMVLLGEPAFPGCAVTARPVGVFWLTDEKGPDAKVLAVPARDPRYADLLRPIATYPAHLLDEIGHFFDIYKELEPGKGTDVRSSRPGRPPRRTSSARPGPGPRPGRHGLGCGHGPARSAVPKAARRPSSCSTWPGWPSPGRCRRGGCRRRRWDRGRSTPRSTTSGMTSARIRVTSAGPAALPSAARSRNPRPRGPAAAPAPRYRRGAVAARDLPLLGGPWPIPHPPPWQSAATRDQPIEQPKEGSPSRHGRLT